MCIHMYTLTHRGVGRGGNIGPPSLLPLQNIGGFVCSHPPPPRNDFILQIILLHTRFYRYDVHDTILLNHIHFWLIIGDAIDVLKKIKISKLCYSYVIVLYIFINNCP